MGLGDRGRLAEGIGINYLYAVTAPHGNPYLKGLCLFLLLIVTVLGHPPAHGQSLSAAADDARLWVLTPETDRPGAFTVYHHALGDTPTQVNEVETLTGTVRPHCLAAFGNTLWVIYADGAVQAIHAEPNILGDGWLYKARVEPRLPTGVSVRATTITQQGPVVLVRIEDQQALARIDGLSQPDTKADLDYAARRQRNLALGLPPNRGIEDVPKATPTDTSPVKPESSGKTDTPSDADQSDQTKEPVESQPAEPDASVTEPVTEKTAELQPGPNADTSTPVALPVDRLLCLVQGQWRTHPLPEDWPHGSEAWLVAQGDQANTTTLIARSSQGNTRQPGAVSVYQLSSTPPGQWSHDVYPISNKADGVAMITVQGQLVLVQHHHEQSQLAATLSVLREGKTLPVGELVLDEVSPTNWSVLGTGNAATLIAQRLNVTTVVSHSFPPLAWTQMNMRGQVVLEPTDLTLKLPSKMDEIAQYALLGFVVILITVLMLAFWRRDAAWNRLDLPTDLVVADLPRRASAAAIDMAPGLLGVMYYFGLTLEDLIILRWPGNGIAHTVSQMLPGAVVIAVFVTHTTLTELVLARTLGKAIVGLRTTTLTGTRPKAWQLLVRGLLKSLDLLPGAWLLLLLPVIAPHRQRLGDLVGRTVVVTDVPPESEDGQDESDQSLGD